MLMEFYFAHPIAVCVIVVAICFLIIMAFVVSIHFSHSKDQTSEFNRIAAIIRKCNDYKDMLVVNDEMRWFWRCYTADENGKKYFKILQSLKEQQLNHIQILKNKVA